MRDLDRFASTTERRITKALVDHLIANGFALEVFDGEAYGTTEPTTDRDAVLDVMCATGSDRLFAYEVRDGKPFRVGTVLLVWGNGEDLVTDYSLSLEDTVQAFGKAQGLW